MKPNELLFAALLLPTSMTLIAGEAHVHGQARLEIAVEGDILNLRLESPLDNLLGFERAPRNERERQAVKRMAAHLNDGATQFQPSPAAGCMPLDSRLEAPALGKDFPAPSANTMASTTSPGGQSKANSAEKPARPHAHAEEEHGELTATWRFRCARPLVLRDLTVKLFVAFPGLRRIDAAAITEKGQSAARLSASQPQLRW